MKLSAYIVKHDSGFSPNPFGGICTLACCKPTIRRNARRGDVVVGTGSARSGLSGRLTYAMRVTAVITFDEYWERYPSKRPTAETSVKRRGDNIWHCDTSGNWCCLPGALHNESNRDRDLGGRNVLISSEFYYFGRNAIDIPEDFRSLIATARGHKNSYEADLIARFWEWLRCNAPKPGRIGLPLEFSDDVCAGTGCSANAEQGDQPDRNISGGFRGS